MDKTLSVSGDKLQKMIFQNEERREFPRYRVCEGAYAFINNVPFTIQDISEGGMRLKSVIFDDTPHENLKLDIFVNNGKFYLRDVPVRLVSQLQDDSNTPFSTIYVRQFGVQFENLDELQKHLLQSMITYNTVGEA